MVNEKDLLLFENDALLEELENYLSTTKLKESEKFNIFKIFSSCGSPFSRCCT